MKELVLILVFLISYLLLGAGIGNAMAERFWGPLSTPHELLAGWIGGGLGILLCLCCLVFDLRRQR